MLDLTKKLQISQPSFLFMGEVVLFNCLNSGITRLLCIMPSNARYIGRVGNMYLTRVLTQNYGLAKWGRITGKRIQLTEARLCLTSLDTSAWSVW